MTAASTCPCSDFTTIHPFVRKHLGAAFSEIHFYSFHQLECNLEVDRLFLGLTIILSDDVGCNVLLGQRRMVKSPTLPGQTAKPTKPGDLTGAGAAANQVGSGAGVETNEQLASDVERNVMLEQQREHLQAQLALQRQLHNELQQHLKLQHEHHQLQAQLMVSCYTGDQ